MLGDHGAEECLDGCAKWSLPRKAVCQQLAAKLQQTESEAQLCAATWHNVATILDCCPVPALLPAALLLTALLCCLVPALLQTALLCYLGPALVPTALLPTALLLTALLPIALLLTALL